jgi:hypothetical protein
MAPEHCSGLVIPELLRNPAGRRVEARALELRQRLSAHPGAVPLMIGGPMDGPHRVRIGLKDPSSCVGSSCQLLGHRLTSHTSRPSTGTKLVNGCPV